MSTYRWQARYVPYCRGVPLDEIALAQLPFGIVSPTSRVSVREHCAGCGNVDMPRARGPGRGFGPSWGHYVVATVYHE